MHEAAHALLKAEGGAANLVKILDVLAPSLREYRGKDVVLVVEVVIHEAVGNACLFGDVGHPRAVESCPGNPPGGRLENALPGERAALASGREPRCALGVDAHRAAPSAVSA